LLHGAQGCSFKPTRLAIHRSHTTMYRARASNAALHTLLTKAKATFNEDRTSSQRELLWQKMVEGTMPKLSDGNDQAMTGWGALSVHLCTTA
jgi:hypothetical protein